MSNLLLVGTGIILLCTVLYYLIGKCEAVKDRTEEPVHYGKSIYSLRNNPEWYLKTSSWILKYDLKLWEKHRPKTWFFDKLSWVYYLSQKRKVKIPLDPFSDAWHTAKTIGTFLGILNMLCIAFLGFCFTLDQMWIIFPLFVLVFAAWLIGFNRYYNHKLKLKDTIPN